MFSYNGQLLASASDDKTVRLWNPATGKCLQELKAHDLEVLGIAFSPDGTLLVSASQDLTITLWTEEKIPVEPDCNPVRRLSPLPSITIKN